MISVIQPFLFLEILQRKSALNIFSQVVTAQKLIDMIQLRDIGAIPAKKTIRMRSCRESAHRDYMFSVYLYIPGRTTFANFILFIRFCEISQFDWFFSWD